MAKSSWRGDPGTAKSDRWPCDENLEKYKNARNDGLSAFEVRVFSR